MKTLPIRFLHPVLNCSSVKMVDAYSRLYVRKTWPSHSLRGTPLLCLDFSSIFQEAFLFSRVCLGSVAARGCGYTTLTSTLSHWQMCRLSFFQTLGCRVWLDTFHEKESKAGYQEKKIKIKSFYRTGRDRRELMWEDISERSIKNTVILLEKEKIHRGW